MSAEPGRADHTAPIITTMTPGPHEELAAALEPVVRRLCDRDPEAARLVAALGRWLTRVASPPEPAAPEVQPRSLSETPAPPSQPPAPALEPEPVPLRIGDAVVHVPVVGTRDEIVAARRAAPPAPAQPEPRRNAWEPPDLGVVAQRCSLKARACEAAAARQEADGPEERRRAQALVDELMNARQSLPDCFLWMFHPDSRVTPSDLRALRPIYENLALACGIAERAPRQDQADFKLAVELLAEAQSALRKGLQDAWVSETDRDQNDAFFWLRRVTESDRIFVQRHMRVDDPADPSKHADLRSRLEALNGRLRAGDNRLREGAKLLKKLRYHASQIANAPADDHAHDWKVVVETAERLGEAGIVPGDDRLTDALEDLLRIPEERWGVPAESRGTLREVRELISSDEGDPAQPQPARAESPDVLRVRDWLRGKRAVFIGGQRYPQAAGRIQRAFGLAELHWIELSEHGKTAPIDPPIADPTTAVVWAVIKLSGHLHLDVAGDACRTYARPFVRLPGGYNPSQIAAQTIAQASAAFERL